MLKVVTEASRFSPDGGSGIVVVESSQTPVDTKNYSKDIESLGSPDARNLAIKYAAHSGCSDPRINGNVSSVYPVNKDGVSLDEVKDEAGKQLPYSHERMQIAAYRVDVPVTKKLI